MTYICKFWANNLVDCLFIWMIVASERNGVLLWVSYFNVVFLCMPFEVGDKLDLDVCVQFTLREDWELFILEPYAGCLGKIY